MKQKYTLIILLLLCGLMPMSAESKKDLQTRLQYSLDSLKLCADSLQQQLKLQNDTMRLMQYRVFVLTQDSAALQKELQNTQQQLTLDSLCLQRFQTAAPLQPDSYFLQVTTTRTTDEKYFESDEYIQLTHEYTWPMVLQGISNTQLEEAEQAMIRKWWPALTSQPAWWAQWQKADAMRRIQLMEEASLNSPEDSAFSISVWFHNPEVICFRQNVYSQEMYSQDYERNFNYSLSLHRELQLTDVFRNPQCTEITDILRTAIEHFWEEHNIHDDDWFSLGEIISGFNLNNYDWTVSSQGIMVKFHRFEIACGTFGYPYLTIPFENNSSLFTPSFYQRMMLSKH